ncbi:MAG: hypothetical protein R3F29_05525 [Planctomycetota bacterium]
MTTRALLRSSLVALGLAVATAPLLPAQTWTWPLNPRQTYLRTNSDSPLAPLVIDLAALGIAPGDWLSVGSMGAFRYINGGTDTNRSLCAVFSSDTTLLATSVQQRVTGAIAAGPHYLSGSTYYGSLPIDIVEDFFCSRALWDDHVQVRVPAGAAFLFVGVHDSLYNDNVDPNGDYGVVVSKLAPPLLPGTGEHLTLRSAVGGVPAETPEAHVAAPGSTMSAELHYPVGLMDGAIYVLLADAVTVGQVPQLLPNVYVQNLFVLRAGVLGSTPGWFDSWSMTAPAGFPGLALVVQGAALSEVTRNAFYETTNAHTFVLQ